MHDIKISGFIEAFSALADAMRIVRDDSLPAYDAVLEEWTRRTVADAKRILNRPNWLLAKALDSKIKHYSDDRKLWAMTGVVQDLRTPSDYRAHTSGSGVKRKKVVARKGRIGPRYERGFALGFDRKITSSPGFYGRFHENGYTQEYVCDKKKSRDEYRVDSRGRKIRLTDSGLDRLERRSRNFGKSSAVRYVHTEALQFFLGAKRLNQSWLQRGLENVDDEILQKIRVYVLQWNQRRYDETYDFVRRR